jgi:hypothetical protein
MSLRGSGQVSKFHVDYYSSGNYPKAGFESGSPVKHLKSDKVSYPFPLPFLILSRM